MISSYLGRYDQHERRSIRPGRQTNTNTQTTNDGQLEVCENETKINYPALLLFHSGRHFPLLPLNSPPHPIQLAIISTFHRADYFRVSSSQTGPVKVVISVQRLAEANIISHMLREYANVARQLERSRRQLAGAR